MLIFSQHITQKLLQRRFSGRQNSHIPTILTPQSEYLYIRKETEIA